MVCEYWPAGNIIGDKNQYFKDNVKAQVKGHKTDTIETGVTGSGSNLDPYMLGMMLATIVVGLAGLN